MSLIIIVGRGHSGTRAISQTLYGSSVYMGKLLNESGDKVPPDLFYQACNIFGDYVKFNKDYLWNFDLVNNLPIDGYFAQLIREYLEDVLNHSSGHKGWKLPETTLVFPWICRMFPNAKFIYLIRDPRDSILQSHITDDLSWFNIRTNFENDIYSQRAVSWFYQYLIVKQTPKPKHFITIRFEDFVLDQETVLKKLEKFLGFSLARVVMRKESVGRWKNTPEVFNLPNLSSAMSEFCYL